MFINHLYYNRSGSRPRPTAAIAASNKIEIAGPPCRARDSAGELGSDGDSPAYWGWPGSLGPCVEGPARGHLTTDDSCFTMLPARGTKGRSTY